ncbi:MAG TPA: SDR family oxidoreductase [Spongiibacteraceae bacterium]|jgi:NAD(P)-dependent dehydrogenase (short-subunit alcohol dehydrogenase family)|nr:SDR family oxidoreductase [Spongiibacteraceae bacterium]HUH38481.1 SDR family oxidoreductase [Spongiibacteraceae bacterium]
MLLANKVVMISGLGPGLGIKLALAAASEGAAAVVLGARNIDNLDAAARRIAALGSTCQVLTMPTDIHEAGQCRALAAETLARFGRIDALINNAFVYGGYLPVETAEPEQWTSVIDTNLYGSVRMTQAVLPAMKAQGGGAILNINSQSSVRSNPGEAAYAASKAALSAVTRHFARELGRYNIRVNTARMGHLGGVPQQRALAEYAAANNATPEQILDSMRQSVALDRICSDDECALAALLLISDYALPISGATLDINGGDFMP